MIRHCKRTLNPSALSESTSITSALSCGCKVPIDSGNEVVHVISPLSGLIMKEQNKGEMGRRVWSPTDA